MNFPPLHDVAPVCTLCSAESSVIKLNCGHSVCSLCLTKDIERKEKEKFGKLSSIILCPISSCDYQLEPQEIQENLPEEIFTAYLEACLQGFIEQEKDLLCCPNPDCSALMGYLELEKNELEKLQTNEITQKAEDGRKLSRIAWIHFNQFRIRCRECHQDFCAQCNVFPYHLGLDCEQYLEYQKANKCRFCHSSLSVDLLAPPSSFPALQNCCRNEECLAIRERCCEKTLACSHYCGGGRGETSCLPCLEDDCLLRLKENGNDTLLSQTKHDFCPICWTSQLCDEPSIRLECGHIIHLECVRKVLENKWNTKQISFAFRNCPLCQVTMNHELLKDLSDPVEEMIAKTLQIGRKILKEENNLTDRAILADPSSEFFGDKSKYILAKMTFYQCSKCETPFYGGRVDCAQAQRDELNSEVVICQNCRGSQNRVSCVNSEHHNFWVYKCRYCCSPAKWFCFGNTHFCTECHDRAGEFRNLDVSLLPQCLGPLHCPLNIEHPPNGEEFVLNCQLCQEENDRDPEVTKRIQRFEAQQRIKRTFVAIFSGFLHFLNWFVLLASFGYAAYSTEVDFKLFFLSALFIVLKVIPLIITVLLFTYQLYYGLFSHPYKRGLGFKKRMLFPHLLIASWMYFVGTISFSVFLLMKAILFSIFTMRVIIEIFALSSFLFSNRLGRTFKLCIVMGIIEGIRLSFGFSMNTSNTVGQISAGLFLFASAISSVSRRERNLFKKLISAKGLAYLVLRFNEIFAALSISYGYLGLISIRCFVLSLYFVHVVASTVRNRNRFLSSFTFLVLSVAGTATIEGIFNYYSISWLPLFASTFDLITLAAKG